jgi:phosphohistidine phosphatase
MRLYLIRHAPAVPYGTPGIPDEERPLTPKGERRWKLSARGLARTLKRPGALLSSPLPRAWRTAEIASSAWRGPRPEPADVLASDKLQEWESLLASRSALACVALVGHEPHLSSLLARLIGSEAARVPFKKGGVAVVDLPGRLLEGGTLLAFLGPGLLRRVAR